MEETKIKTMNKKGLTDIFYILAFIFAIGVLLFAVFLTMDRINSSGLFSGYDDAEQTYALGERSILNFDNIMLMIIVGLSLYVVISSAFVFNHPIFLILGLVLLAVALTVAGVISNAWFDFSTNSQIEDITTHFSKTNFLMSNLPFYVLFMSISSLIAMSVGYRRFA